MRLRELAELLGCEILSGGDRLDHIEVRACFAADLMSDVLRFSDSDTILITGLTSIQSVHTADVADMTAILYVSDKRPGQPVLDLAATHRLPVLVTSHGMFDACGILYGAKLKPAC
jgi:predicted transcriptional regulator